MENKNGQGIFYGVIGVATLVVAIIGATFAYFSASVTGNGANIEGNTANVAGDLSLEVERVTFDSVPATVKYTDLVPAAVTEDETGWGSMLTAKCVNGEYTGCHLYKVTASTSNAVAATIVTNVDTTGSPKTNWKYVVYQGSASTITANSARAYTMGSGNQTIFNSTLPTTDTVYYILVYLLNTNSVQNDSQVEGGTAENGTYSGTVTLNAAGGHVQATFS